MVSVKVSKQNMPFIGKGRWTLNPSLLRDKEITTNLSEELQRLQEALNDCSLRCTNKHNPQTVFKAFKDRAIAIIRNRAKKIIPMARQKISKLQEWVQTILNDSTIPDDDCLLLSTDLREQINTTRQTLYNSVCDCSHLRMRIECESPASRLWAQSGKDRKPRDSITELLSPNSTPDVPTYINCSDKMAELAHNYYKDLQSKDLAPLDICQRKTDEVLSKVMTNLPDEERLKLDQDITLE